ncbi:MAG TPA: phosphopyruvate hydratase [Candidatus Babeliales bacterium]|jgi:enolase|nr:phosphopyruvate hydratase [Candidatus Babeliales bacterium]
MKINSIHAREIFDSRGIPTVECAVVLSDGMTVTASVPAGISRSTHEAVELRDGGERLMGLGVQKAVSVIEEIIAPTLIDRDLDVVVFDLDMLNLDQTNNKSHLGANAILATSMAVCKAQAYTEGLELYEFIAHISQYSTVALPCPMFNMLGGGVHADNNFQIQELLIVPTKEFSFHDAMATGVAVYQVLKDILRKKGKLTAVGYEGEFVPSFDNEYEPFDLMMEAIAQSGNGSNVMLSLDVAASQFYNSATGMYQWINAEIAAHELIEWYDNLISRYPIYSIEDGLAESDWNGWHEMKHILGSRIKIVGDDLFATDPQRIWYGIEHDSATTALIKPNQIGTVTETLQAIQLCKDNEWDVIVSHRSGETNDTFIADLAVGVSAQHIKTGGCSRGERMAKYNRLLQIEKQLMSV